MRIALIIGIRPEIIKCAPLIRRLRSSDLLIHTNQHYSPELDADFFKEFDLRLPDYNLHTGSGTHAEQTAAVLTGVESVLMNDNPDIVLVQGDTNSWLGGALDDTKKGFSVAYIEAGLRSGDRSMAEEMNRIIIDHISDYLFTPTNIQTQFLQSEEIPHDKIFEVGNTIADTFHELSTQDKPGEPVAKDLDNPFALLTLHRPENLDNNDRLYFLTSQINLVAEELPIRFSMHPRTKNRILQMDIPLHPNVTLMPPQPYFMFLNLLRKASIVLTDSGGVQEEACILSTPCITLRTTTERQETLQTGINWLMSDDLLNDVHKSLNEKPIGVLPYQPGATKNILNTIGHSL